MPELGDIVQIRRGEHVVIIGMTGSGKTYLARQLLAVQSGGILVLDTKSTLKWSGYSIIRDNSLRAIRMAKNGERVIFRPPWGWGKAQYDMFFALLMKDKRPMIIYIDEIFAVANQHTAPNSALGAIRTRGREFGITMWASTQFPRRVPFFLLSEATHFFVFFMALPAYQKMISELAEQPIPIANLREYEFYYKKIRREPVGPLRIGSASRSEKTAAV